MKKVKYLMRAESTYCCKGQVLVHMARKLEHKAYFNSIVCGDRKEEPEG
jgi:hypothetical protein